MLPNDVRRNPLACAKFMARAFTSYSMDDIYRLADFLVENTAVVLSVSEAAPDPYIQRSLPQPQPYARLRPEVAPELQIELRPQLRLVSDSTTQPELVLRTGARDAVVGQLPLRFDFPACDPRCRVWGR